MNNDQRAHRIAMTIFAAVLTVVMMAAFITTIEGVDARQVNDVAQPGTIGIAHPHPPLDRAPGEPIQN
jgi:hypothetical protein